MVLKIGYGKIPERAGGKPEENLKILQFRKRCLARRRRWTFERIRKYEEAMGLYERIGNGKVPFKGHRKGRAASRRKIEKDGWGWRKSQHGRLDSDGLRF